MARQLDQSNDYLPSLAMRWASRETFRRAALRWTMPGRAARTRAGSASCLAGGGLLGGLGISHGVSDVDLSKTWTCRAVYLEESQAKRLTPWVGLMAGWGGGVNAGLFFLLRHALGAYCLVAGNDGGTVGRGKGRKWWRHAGPL